MPKYKVRLTDGYCFEDVYVEAETPEQACHQAFEAADADDDFLCGNPFDSDGNPEYVDAIDVLVDAGEDEWTYADIPVEYASVQARMLDAFQRIQRAETLEEAKTIAAAAEEIW